VYGVRRCHDEAHTIHIFSHYQENNQTIPDKITSLKATTTHMLLPCLLTTITTAIGFSSLAVSDISAVRDFGVFTAVGVVFAFIVVLSVVPNILYYIPRSKIRTRGKTGFGIIERLLSWLSVFVQKKKQMVVIISVMLSVIAIIGITRITVETDVINYFRKSSDIYRSTFFISHNLSGTGSLNVYIGGGEEDAIKNPAVLKEMEQLQRYLEAQENVTKTISLVDFLKDMNLAMHDENRDYYAVPESRELVAQYLLLYSMSGDPDDFERFVDFYYENGTVLARTKPMSSKVLLAFVDDVILFCDNNFSDDLDVRVTGTSVLYDNMSTLLVKSQIRSILLALVMIFIVMSIVFRSVYIGGLSMIPNVIPIFLTMGLMGWLMINLDTSTTMISSVAIGIAIDDTVHFITRYFREISDGATVENAIHETILNTGRPIMFTSVVIGSGFVVLLAASFIPTRSFGILTAFTMFSALVADLFVLPVVLMAARPSFRGWKGFALDK
jgi:predicted RND superfamily exporter protein